ncbi:glycosyltransferase family 4 protein [Halomicrobium salinisoli]|uniref:glycosyltransferase family 4 protein n=1 Tax=Halomicrobium salinisoli TaxID=2878391 RepID=UPI001CF0A02E|nr:glycosyltransferase family 4 protein [Halomicrobium salinisoli]
MVKVLHLITRYLDGGAEVTTRNTLRSLAEADEEYDLYLGTGHEHDEKNLKKLESEGITTTVFPLIRHYNPVTAVLAVLTVARYLRREEVDVLHTHSTEAGIIGRLAAFVARTPVVVHEVHGDPVTDDRNPVLNAFLRTMERQCARVADRLVVKADRIRELYLDRGIGRPEQYERIYHGVDLSRFDETATHDSKRILFVGRLERGKGLFDLLEAFESVDDAKLLIAGTGALYEPLADAVRDQELEAELLGYCDDVPSLMASADVFVLPSYREGTPRVITEAMAAGLPVVATDIAGIPEQVRDGETGYLVEPGDVRSLSDHLEELLDDPQKRTQFGRAGRERVTRFALETAQERYRKLYRVLTGP